MEWRVEAVKVADALKGNVEGLVSVRRGQPFLQYDFL
jgi:hypothetical protein